MKLSENLIEREYRIQKIFLKFRRIEKLFINFINNFLKFTSYKLVNKKSLLDFYLHEYKSYEEYARVQIYTNKRKINSIFADEKTLKRV